MKNFSFIVAAFFLFACGGNDAPIGLERKNPDELLKSGSCINVVNDSIDYMPSQSRESETAIEDAKGAYQAICALYPDKAKGIKCWTEYKGYFIFSVGFNDPQTDCKFWHILYVKKGEKKFRYFWPHT